MVCYNVNLTCTRVLYQNLLAFLTTFRERGPGKCVCVRFVNGLLIMITWKTLLSDTKDLSLMKRPSSYDKFVQIKGDTTIL